jgi:hypothetical protein
MDGMVLRRRVLRLPIGIRYPKVLVSLAVVLAVTSGCTSSGAVRELRGSLSKAEAIELLDQAEAAVGAIDIRQEPGFRCWFDRIPSGSLTVPCGPVDPGSSVVIMGGPPPYYVVLHIEPVEDEGTGKSFGLVVPDSPGIFSYADHPADLFRPDGERIRP